MTKFHFVFLSLLFASCANHGQLTFITQLPNKLNENSGIIHFQDSRVWFVEDNGNGDNLYEVDFKGNLLRKLKVKNAKNHDWEDLTKNKNGNIYIGDFGNNDNDRKNLVIYKIPDPRSHSKEKTKVRRYVSIIPSKKTFRPQKTKELMTRRPSFTLKITFIFSQRTRPDHLQAKHQFIRWLTKNVLMWLNSWGK